MYSIIIIILFITLKRIRFIYPLVIRIMGRRRVPYYKSRIMIRSLVERSLVIIILIYYRYSLLIAKR